MKNKTLLILSFIVGFFYLFIGIIDLSNYAVELSERVVDTLLRA